MSRKCKKFNKLYKNMAPERKFLEANLEAKTAMGLCGGSRKGRGQFPSLPRAAPFYLGGAEKTPYPDDGGRLQGYAAEAIAAALR